MYNASKRLQAIRRQLLHMDEQYRNGIDNDEDNSTIETDNCQNKPEDLVEKVIWFSYTSNVLINSAKF